MNCFNINLFFGLILLTQLSYISPAKDWIKWIKAFKLVKVELLSGRSLGIHKDPPSSFDILTDGLKYNIDPTLLVDSVKHGINDADLIYGRGMILKGNPLSPITFSVDLPTVPSQTNVCGVVITSLTDEGCEFIYNLQAMWQSDVRVSWDLFANPSNGAFEYNLRMRPGENTRIVIFDSTPALHLLLMLSTIPGKNINLKLALLQNCRYKNTIDIKDCSEKIDNNPRFAMLPSQVPLSIRCPIDCIRSWPCWGFKVYSSDSPLCWTANQNFGRYGNGLYTLYKIPGVAIFRSEVNPLLTHGVFCRQSILPYSGYTFDRKYFDFTKQEYRDTMGA